MSVGPVNFVKQKLRGPVVDGRGRPLEDRPRWPAATDRLVLVMYADESNDDGLILCGIRYISEVSECDISTARNATQRLVARGILELLDRGGGRGRKAIYRLVMDLDEIDKRWQSTRVSPDGSPHRASHDPDSDLLDDADRLARAADILDDVDGPPVDTDDDLGDEPRKQGQSTPHSGVDKRSQAAPLSDRKGSRYARDTRAKGGYGTPPDLGEQRPPVPRSPVIPPTPRSGEPETVDPRVGATVDVLARRQLAQTHTVVRDGPRLDRAREAIDAAWSARLVTFAALHPDATPEQLADLCVDDELVARWREPLERRGRQIAAWATDPTSTSFDPGFAAMSDDALVEYVTESVTTLVDPAPSAPPPDPRLVAVTVAAFRAERARLLSQSESQEVR